MKEDLDFWLGIIVRTIWTVTIATAIGGLFTLINGLVTLLIAYLKGTM